MEYACAKPNAVTSMKEYLTHVPHCDAVIYIELDIETSVQRCKQRPKGLPKLYQALPEAEIIEVLTATREAHRICAAHQEAAGIPVIRLDATRPPDQLCHELHETLVNLR